MICITGLDRSIDDLLERFTRTWAFPLHEIRLDALEEPLPTVEALPVVPDKLVVACRRTGDGGLFQGTEAKRLGLLRSAIEEKPRWIDLEADLSEAMARPLLERARAAGVRVLRSLHLLKDGGAGAVRKGLDLLSRAEGDGIKLAARVDDLVRLEEFLEAPGDRPAVLIGMGPAGILTRALHLRFRSAWTYVSHHSWPDPSAGIPDLETAVLWDMPVANRSPLYALLGGPSILASPGPLTYNRLFREKRFKGIYLPAVTERLEEVFSLLTRLNLAGASVTIPHKIRAVRLAAELGAHAAAVQAVNTLHLDREGRWRGENTDVPAIQAVVERLAPRPLGRGVILGSGGFARAAAFALSQRGVEVFLLARRVLREPGPWKASLPLEAIRDLAFDVLVNATPIGSVPGEDPLDSCSVDFAGKLVLDAVLSDTSTALMRRAEARGAVVAGGLAFWVEQGARQLALFGAPAVTPDELAQRVRNSSGPPPSRPPP